MAEIEPEHVHAHIEELRDRLFSRTGWPQRRHDFGAAVACGGGALWHASRLSRKGHRAGFQFTHEISLLFWLKGSGRFLKKAAQKLLLLGPLRVALSAPQATAQINKVFLLLFVHKKKRFLPLSLSTPALCRAALLG
jgi:hypothetical protein